MGEVLTLRTSGGRLWRTVREPLAACLGELHGGPYECRLGGGTILAARWRHRDSFDVDLTVSPGAILGSLRPRLDEAMAALGGAADYRRGQWKIDFDAGQVDLSSLQPYPVGAQRTAIVDDEPFIVLSTSQILNGKLERASRSPVRDVFENNVLGGERMRDVARIAVAASTPLTWETGQLAPGLPDDQPPRHQPRNR